LPPEAIAVRVALWERWLRQPKSLWLRKALFQVHLWTGVALGLYVLVVSVTGSAIVFRNELYKSLWPGPTTVAISGPPLTHDQLRSAARRAYPQYKVSWIWDTTRRNQAANQAVEIWMDRDGHRKERLFDPYTGQDLGESRPYSIQLLAWLADLHINLLGGKVGRIVNGVGAIFIVIISITGAVIWWPGVRIWRRGLAMQPASNWKLFNWELHSVIGFWMLPVVFVFGVVGIYAGIPGPFRTLVSRYASPRAGEKIIRWFSYLHFGNFGGWPSKAVWVILGLAPAFLFVTGALMWWNRVLWPAALRVRRSRASVI
jgi:uncharacterized iron-regulated membrane protein